MTDRVYPNGAASSGETNPTAAKNPPFPAAKSQLYGATRPPYRPQPHHRRRERSRSCCCSIFLYLIIFIIFVIFVIGIAAAVIYLLYRPHRPSFSVTALKLSTFNITSSSQLTSKFDLNITAKNPNKKLVFLYDPISLTVTSNGVDVGDGSFPAFVHRKKNTTLLTAAITSSGQELDSAAASSLKSVLKSKSGLALELKLGTKLKMKMGGLKTPKIGIRVLCTGISATVPTGKTAVKASVSKAECKVDSRIKIWKWTV